MTNKNKGIILIISAAFFAALMGLFVNLAGDLPAMQKSFIRNIVALVFALFITKKSRVSFVVEKSNRLLLFIRCLAGTIGLMASFYSMDKLPLSDWTMIGKLALFSLCFFLICFCMRAFQDSRAFVF